MILAALADYYARRVADRDSGIAPPGWEWKALPFLIEIEPSGRFVGLVDTRTPDGSHLVPHRFLVPQGVVRTSGVKANLLWDNLGYVLGPVGNEVASRPGAHEKFVAEIADRFGDPPAEPGVAAVLSFVRKAPLAALRTDPLWPEAVKAGGFVSFRIAGETDLVCQTPAVRAVIDAPPALTEIGPDGICLVTGNRGPIARLHPPIKGVRGANTSGASVVSFNLPAFESFHRSQGDNAPVDEATVFAYTTALNSLLARDSRQRALVADTTVVFWGERAGAATLETALGALFSEPPADDPHAGTDAITALYTAHRTGAPPADEGGRFFVLGLAPNTARLSVRFWQTGTVREIGELIVAHFDDVSLAHASYEPEHPTLFRLLTGTAVQGRGANVPPLLGGEVVRSIMTGAPYPHGLLEAAVRRSRAEQEVSYVRAAAIKATLNRLIRSGRLRAKEYNVSLDPANPDPAYRLGRLFAALERTQELGNPGTHATIRDRYYGAASTTPLAVFPRLLALKNHHVAKIESPRLAVWAERTIGEITDGIAVIPAHLPLPAQGAFALGYYHQRQDFFTPKSQRAAEAAAEEGNA